MGNIPWRALAVVLATCIAQSSAHPALPSRPDKSSMPLPLTLRQDDNTFNPKDLLYIARIAAIGSKTLQFNNTPAGRAVKPGTTLRILPVGDSITVGSTSEQNGGDGNNYRLQLHDDLSKDQVVFAGTETYVGSMNDGYFAAWSGQTIQYIADNIGPSLEQRPNIILVHAGTNDMNPNPEVSKEGNDPKGAADRLGKLVGQMIKTCPDATILVAMIISTCDPAQQPRTQEYQALIPGVVKTRRDAGHHVLAVDFTSFETSRLRDCIHPTDDGYKRFGDYWYDFTTQIPTEWIRPPVGPDPVRAGGIDANGGLDKNIPAPDWGSNLVDTTPRKPPSSADLGNGTLSCKAPPVWWPVGKIADEYVGHNGDWKYKKNWVEAGKVADGLHLDPANVRLHDMNGDGKADYVWLHPETGEITCWLNNLPDPWSLAGTNKGIIASGAGRAESVFIADMNGDGLEDYMVVNQNNGAVHIWWNYGPDANWVNGWKFVDGGQIASGVPHANWKTLRFPDINDDGRADYVYIGEGGALKHYLNTGSPGGQDVIFRAQGGIATGATSDISQLVFADIDGDGRDDYLIWDNDGGLTGFLNQPTHNEGVPIYIDQGPAKTVADGVKQKPSSMRLADIDGDGRDDYAYIDEEGAIWLWWNRGIADTSMAIDGLRLADMDGSGLSQYVWLDPTFGAPIVYFDDNMDAGTTGTDRWSWTSWNDGKPIASGAAPASQVKFADINGDGKDDYLVVDPKTGAIDAYLNGGQDKAAANAWKWTPIGNIASGLGPGDNVRFADIDGDGYDDYIYLKPDGGTVIYRNVYSPKTPQNAWWKALPEADASGIGQRPAEIEFYDLNGDGKADYVWTNVLDGSVSAWYNNYPNKPIWLEQGKIADGVGISGSCVRYGRISRLSKTSYLAVDPGTGAIAAWLNGCDPSQYGTKPSLATH